MSANQVHFYTKPECKLCDEAKAMLETYQLMYEFEVIEHNIEENNQLHEQYFLKIPVVNIGEVELDATELNMATLDDVLSEKFKA
ncbi:glutaredoxin family protein [Aquisalibacillus elongatus]|uniref:Glutaredoxin-like protein DUF836 n=1 Tax=Aquisalibacillus elongatus TaxID=485577 RepID=A0A3N5C4T6_9BACI|nr:glutaredoxin family protein [Aquisalibacillus elongatus]RPF54442.1 glutaredoxin-like protein DUF836 [Aquisalibacillus elongatus]